MRPSLFERSAFAVWSVVALLFLVILVFHVREREFTYSHITVPLRPGEPAGIQSIRPNPNAGFQTSVVIGPNGTVTRRSFANGIPLDAPLRDFAQKFNNYIDELNTDREQENLVAIILDAIGFLTALFSAGYEFLEPRSAGAAPPTPDSDR